MGDSNSTAVGVKPGITVPPVERYGREETMRRRGEFGGGREVEIMEPSNPLREIPSRGYQPSKKRPLEEVVLSLWRDATTPQLPFIGSQRYIRRPAPPCGSMGFFSVLLFFTRPMVRLSFGSVA